MLLLVISGVSFGLAATGNADKWADYASGDFDITPNIVYGRANNTDLKLDLYLPKNRRAPVPALLLFHGGGWVGGQKERNVFQLCRIFRWVGRF